MQLRLSRSQEQNRRGIEFVLTATAVLSAEEKELVQKYGLSNQIIAKGTVTRGVVSKRQEPTLITTANLVGGWTQSFDDLGSMIAFERTVTTSCENLMVYLDAARRFGGDETIEIHMPEDGIRGIGA